MRKRASMAAVSYTPPPPMKIEPVFDIPEIYKPPKLFTDGKSLFDTYEQWKSEIKEDYTMRTGNIIHLTSDQVYLSKLTLSCFAENGRELSWKGIEEVHGGASAKDVYHKLRPFCQLVDSFIEQGYSEQKVLGKLEAIRLNFGVLPSNFMKVVLKSWHLDTTSSQFSKYIPIDKIQFRSLVLEMLTE